MIFVPSIILFSGLLILGLSVPLIHRKVPMNAYYGFRVAASFASQERWYAINEYSGRLLAKWAALPILTGITGFFVPADWRVEYSAAAAVAFVCTAAIPLFMTFRWIQKTYAVQPGAPPNGGPAASVDKSNAPGGPPSVS